MAKCKYRITNNISGIRWVIDALEDSLKSFCTFHGLDIQTYKSGILFKHLSFVISGIGGSEQDGRMMLEQVKALVKQFE